MNFKKFLLSIANRDISRLLLTAARTIRTFPMVILICCWWCLTRYRVGMASTNHPIKYVRFVGWATNSNFWRQLYISDAPTRSLGIGVPWCCRFRAVLLGIASIDAFTEKMIGHSALRLPKGRYAGGYNGRSLQNCASKGQA